MIVNVNHSTTASFYNVREKKTAQPSTYKQRVIADRIVMGLMFLGTIIFAVITA